MELIPYYLNATPYLNVIPYLSATDEPDGAEAIPILVQGIFSSLDHLRVRLQTNTHIHALVTTLSKNLSFLFKWQQVKC